MSIKYVSAKRADIINYVPTMGVFLYQTHVIYSFCANIHIYHMKNVRNVLLIGGEICRTYVAYLSFCHLTK